MCAIINTRLKREANFTMIAKKLTKNWFRKAIFGCLFAMMGAFGLMAFGPTNNVYADPPTETPAVTEQTQSVSCEDSLGSLGWLVCPTTGKISEAVDWLYKKIEDILVIQPVEMKDGSPIYEIWKYARGVTNIVFIILFLVVIYSQLTGVGISNYGVKKILPKMIVVAILVNLSFIICSLAVDVSNIVGNSLRGLFASIEESTMATMDPGMISGVSMSEMYSSMAGGAALAVGAGVIAFETGSIWMLIPVVLGAIVAVASGLITIALRQAVVALLIMVSPLAIVAYMLPNTEDLFKRWKKLLTQMLVFYPMFSLLFGASNLAGWAIITSAKDGFGLMLGVAVQIFPLFFSWSLMKMSGTFLSTINGKIQSLAARPLATNRAWADSRRQLTRQKTLSSGRAYTPSARLMQFMSDRRVARDEETKEHAESVRLRGQAYAAMRNYKKDGKYLSGEGEESYAQMIRNIGYQRTIDRHKHTFNGGVGNLGANQAQTARLKALDSKIIREADKAKMEGVRGELIEMRNAEGFYKRMEDAINAHMDDEKGYVINPETGMRYRREDYKFHFDGERAKDLDDAIARYADAKAILGKRPEDIHFAAANAAQAYDTQKKILETKMQKYFELLPPTRDVEYRLGELTMQRDADKIIDSIIPGLRILNQRGDTDLLRIQLENVLKNGEGIELGTHASQALASFLMFEVKDNDPFLRRFGKYINLETAQVYNKNKRQNTHLSLDEYITGEYEDWEPVDNNAPGGPQRKIRVGKSKRAMAELIEGTSLDNVERTAYSNLDDMLKNTYTKNGKLDEEKYFAKREEIETAIGPAFISANLKYLSGSEQLKNAISFLTGYNGDKPAWEDEKNPLYGSEMAEKYYRRKTIEYLKNQTPSQILGLRSDYYGPLMAHLIKEYENADTTGWSDEAIAEREEYMRERAEIQTRYGDLPAEEAQEKRKKDFKALREKMAGAQFRQTLDSKGMLNQIYRTRRSGAANNAKNWLRGWLNLDDEALITLKLKNDRDKMNKNLQDLINERTEKKGKGEADSPIEEDKGNRIYDESDTVRFTTEIEDLWEDLKTDDDNVFYDESLRYLKKELGEDSYIVREYEQYHKDDPYADGHTLKEFLLDILSDLDNY